MEMRRQFLQAWKQRLLEFFSGSIPATMTWHQRGDIIKALKFFAMRDFNHMFLPTGGGQDLTDVRIAHEPECMEMRLGGAVLVRPLILTFNAVDVEHIWSYFRLETGGLSLSVVYNGNLMDARREELTEVSPLHYYPRHVYDAGYLPDDSPIPSSARVVTRIMKGSFVLFSKGSPYNWGRQLIGDTYDGRHDEMTPLQFLDRVNEYADHLPALV